VVTGTVTRRGLLAAGVALGLVGCGAPEEPPPDADLLAPSLAAALALAAAYERAGGRLGRELAEREREHAERLRAAGAAPGAAAPDGAADGTPLESALALERAAMRAHVRATGLVRARPARTLTAELLAEDARHASLLLARLGREPLPTAFPDGRDA
jgi:hypothetical protein